jgi:transposase
MKKVTVFETEYERTNGIDIGAEKIFVSADGVEVVSFDTFTKGYYQCVNKKIRRSNQTERKSISI